MKGILMSGIFFFMVAAIVSCSKDAPVNKDLPPATEEGKNTFGCYIDGSPFVAKVRFTIGGPMAVSGIFDEETNDLKLQATRENSEDHLESIKIRATLYEGEGSYFMRASHDEVEGYVDYSGNKCTYYHDLTNLGTIVITYLNPTKNIIAGTFEMELVNPDCYYKTLKITEGRFDFGY
jgi:hypothetical protein